MGSRRRDPAGRPPRAHLLLAALGKRRPRRRQGRGCGRSGAARRVRVGREAARIARGGRPARALARPPRPGVPRRPFPPRRSQRAARRPGGTPSRPARPAARRRLSAGVHAGRLLASGPRRLSSPGAPGPAHRTPRTRLPAAKPTQKVPAALRHPARAPAPAIFVDLQLPSEPGETERKGGGRTAAGKTATSSPRAVPRSAAVGARRPPAGAPDASPLPCAPRPRARRRGRELPGAYRNLLCGVTAFRLNPASSSRPSSRPLRRSRMLARCAAPPPGSWVAAEDAAAQRGRSGRRAGVPGREAGKRAGGRPARGRGLSARPRETRAQQPVGLT